MKTVIELAKEAGFEIVDEELRVYPVGDTILMRPNYIGTLTDGICNLIELVRAEAFKEAAKVVAAVWGYVKAEPVKQEPVAWASIESLAVERYKVVPSHDSMFYRYAVVAGDGKQQLYIGREVECENMARKFAGAFLDGAFFMSDAAPVDAKAIREQTLEEAAKWFEDEEHPLQPKKVAAAIRGLK